MKKTQLGLGVKGVRTAREQDFHPGFGITWEREMNGIGCLNEI